MTAPGTEHAGATSTDEQAIRKLAATLMAALNRGDTREFAAHFHEDADFTNVIGIHVHGRDAIQTMHNALFTEPRTPDWPSFRNAVTTIHDTRVRFIRPDVAVVDIRWAQKGALGPDGQPWGDRRGLMNWVAVKESGQWSVAASHNMDLPR